MGSLSASAYTNTSISACVRKKGLSFFFARESTRPCARAREGKDGQILLQGIIFVFLFQELSRFQPRALRARKRRERNTENTCLLIGRRGDEVQISEFPIVERVYARE